MFNLHFQVFKNIYTLVWLRAPSHTQWSSNTLNIHEVSLHQTAQPSINGLICPDVDQAPAQPEQIADVDSTSNVNETEKT